MPQGLRIAVISHEIDDFENSGYLLNRLTAEWRSQGVTVAIVHGPGEQLPDADLAILHTDITAVGEDYGRLVDHYPRVINGRVRDTSKTVFSDLLVRRDSGWRGPVIVKTNLNYGGMREMRQRYLNGDMTSTITIQRPWRRVAWLEDYPVFDSPAGVPNGVWQNPNLVVEKFLPDRNADGEYLLKVWVFLGDREIYYQGVSNEPVVKGENTLRREFLDPSDLPAALRETRRRLGFDYGKFDFGLAGGAVALYDVNRTPAFPRLTDEPPAITEAVRSLSAGLAAFTA
jgi:hypothetical protein